MTYSGLGVLEHRLELSPNLLVASKKKKKKSERTQKRCFLADMAMVM